MPVSYYVEYFANLPLQPKEFDRKAHDILQLPYDDERFPERVRLLVTLAREVLAFCEEHVQLPDNIYDFYITSKP